MIQDAFKRDDTAEAVRLMDVKRKFVADEREWQTEKHRTMSYGQAMLMLTAAVASFKMAIEQYADTETRDMILQTVQTKLGRVLNVDP